MKKTLYIKSTSQYVIDSTHSWRPSGNETFAKHQNWHGTVTTDR